MTRFLIVLFCLTQAVAYAAKSAPAYRLMFYCSEHQQVARYKVNSEGITEVVAEPFGTTPPYRVIIPLGGEREASLVWVPGHLSSEITVPAKSEGGSGKIVLQADDIVAQAREAKASVKPAAKAAAGSESKSSHTTFAEVTLLSPAVPQLVFMYQPEAKGRWMPPKSLVLDISSVALPDGACAIVNLSANPIQALLGTKGRPVTVASGAFAIVTDFDRDAEGYVLTRVAMATATGVKRVVNAPRDYARSGRSILVVQSVDPAVSGGRFATAKVLTLPSSAPAPVPDGKMMAPKAAGAK